MDTIRYQLTSDQHLSDLQIDLNSQDYITHISADTGLGKSSWVMKTLSQVSNVIFAVPLRSQITQLQARYVDCEGVTFFYGGHRGEDASRIMVCTYEQLPYVQSLTAPHQYLLVIDEVHKLYQAASYRADAIAMLLDTIEQQRFAGVITLSATFTSELVPYQIDTWIDVSRGEPIQRKIDLDVYSSRGAMEDALLELASADSAGPLVIRINNKADIQMYLQLLETSGLNCLAVSQDLQESDAVQTMLTTESVAPYDVILTTCLLDEAININDLQIQGVVVFNSRIHPEELKQFVGRFRLCNPPITLLVHRTVFGGDAICLDTQWKKDRALVNNAKCLAGRMQEKHDTLQAVRKVNATFFELFQFQPLRIHRSGIATNEPAIMANLYRLDTQQHYRSVMAAEDSFQRIFPRLEFLVTDLNHAADAENDDLFEGALDGIEAERQKTLQRCKNLVDVELKKRRDTGNDVDTLNVIETSARIFRDTPEGDFLSRWASLHREVLSNADDAFEVLELRREKAVWKFHDAAEGSLTLQPILKHLLTLPVGTKMTLKEARDQVLTGLRKAAKDYPPFKDAIAAAKVKGLTVKKNNHISVTDRYVRETFRHYTATKPYRSNNKDQLRFDGIGPFGYQYRLRDLRYVFDRPRKKRIRRLKQHLGNKVAR